MLATTNILEQCFNQNQREAQKIVLEYTVPAVDIPSTSTI